MKELVRDLSWRQRLDGVVPRQVDECSVLIAGCGSVGSFIASELARHGVRRFTLIDPDIVEWANLTRTVYGHRDIGRFKTDALKDHLLGIFDDIVVETYPTTVQALGESLQGTLGSVNLVVGGVDDPAGTGRLNRYAYAVGVPSVFVGLYRGAKGGEIVMTKPGATSCFQCATGGVRDAASVLGGEAVERARDYGSNRLTAEVALGADIHFVSAAAVKVAISLLAMSESGSSLARFVGEMIESGTNYLLMGMTPNYFLFPSTHKDAVGQYAFQSLWLKTSPRSECPVCGNEESRESLR